MLNAMTKSKSSIIPSENKSAEIIPLRSTRVETVAVVPIHKKYLLTIREASAYFNIGVKRMRRLAEDNTDSFSLCNGSRYLIIRPKFENYLDEVSSI